MASEKWQEFSDKRKEPYLYTFEWLKQIKSTKLKTPFLDVNSQEFGKAQLKDLKEQLLKGRSGKGKGHKTSAKIVLEHLRAVMEYLKTNEVEYGRVLNPFLKFDMSYTGNDRAFATLDDLDLAVQQADQLNLGSVGTALLLSYWTTIRVGYIHKLHWNKYKKNYITIYQEKEDTEVDFYLYDDKGKCLYPELAKRLESEYKNKKGVFICMLNAKNRHGKYLNRFNKYTDRYLKDNVKKVLDSIRDKLSDPKIVFASFRKGALSDAQVNIPTKDIRAFSGHKSTSVLTKNYLAKEHLKEKAKITQFKIAKLRGRK